MKSPTAEARTEPVQAERPAFDLERECETWNWARAAGVSDHELRRALREMLRSPQDL